MAGHSRPKDGVAALAYVPAISFRRAANCRTNTRFGFPQPIPESPQPACLAGETLAAIC